MKKIKTTRKQSLDGHYYSLDKRYIDGILEPLTANYSRFTKVKHNLISLPYRLRWPF